MQQQQNKTNKKIKLQPYYGYTNQEVISMVRARQLLPCPEACPSAVYSLMVECWHEQAVRRPSFPEIGHRLKIWYQAQKRSIFLQFFLNFSSQLTDFSYLQGDQSDVISNCPSRKGSTFSVVNRQSNSITPSTSSHHITVSSRERDMDAPTGNASRDVDKSFGTNHSLDRGHGHSHSHHHHHHHHSLDRDSANFTNHTNLSCSSASTKGQFCTNTPPSSSVVAKSRSSTSNNSLSLSNHIHSSEEQLNQHRKSNIDTTGNEWNETTGCLRGGSDRSRPMMKPPKDPKSSSHHHHSRHKLNDEHHHQHQHRKKSVGSVGDADGASIGGMRKISAAGSVSSVLSENSMGSYSKGRTNSNDFSHKMQSN